MCASGRCGAWQGAQGTGWDDLQACAVGAALPLRALPRPARLAHRRTADPHGCRRVGPPLAPLAQLACEGDIAHVVVMPNITIRKLETFVQELVESR